MKNWKTTLSGVLFAIGVTLKTHGTQSFEYWIGEVLMIGSPILFGAVAKDHDQTGVPK